MNPVAIRRAILSVSDKTGIVEFAGKLRRFGVEIISTGGTLKALRDAGISAAAISDVTGFPEILDGRVKTLHPKIHAGLLAVSENAAHRKEIAELGIAPIDLVAVNLYPFEKTVAGGEGGASAEVSLEEAIEQIDIGGPSMLRAAAKNFRFKAAVADPSRYESIIAEMERLSGAISEETRFALAREVFLRTARYDAAISRYLERVHPWPPSGGDTLPEEPAPAAPPDTFSVTLKKARELRYGENPHQKGALYGDFGTFFDALHGKELSYNNIVDIQAACELLEEFTEPTVVIVKHTNPCGAASGPTLAEAYQKAFATDTKSAFGGIVAVNRPLDLQTAELIDKVFTEVVIAPAYPADVLGLLKRKKDRRLMRQLRPVGAGAHLVVKAVAGGLLVQTPDSTTLGPDPLRVVTRRAPSEGEKAAMEFAWRVAKHVKSNAIVYARSDRTVGIGAGQMSRFDSSRIAAEKARDAGLDLAGTAVASDAFFPFADGLLEAVKAGATAVIQPGGSVRDPEVIKAADEHHITMLFTGIRHFRH